MVVEEGDAGTVGGGLTGCCLRESKLRASYACCEDKETQEVRVAG